MSRPALKLELQPVNRGRLMDAAQVAADIFSGSVSAQWVIRHVQAGRVKLGHCTVRFWEHPVRAWLEQRTQEKAS